MCGRYSLGLSNEEVYDGLEARLPQLFEQGRPRWEREQDHQPRYNVAPRQRATVIRRDSENGQAMIEEMQWGLIPHWTKHPPSGGLNTINARSEGLLDASSGGMWHALKGYKRCIVPAQGYYEWLKRPSQKVAHFTRHPLSPSDTTSNPPLIFFAGLYDHVKYQSPVESRFKPSEDPSDTRESFPTGNPIPLATFTILTTTPSKDIEWLHDRMPCILDKWEDVHRWLDLGEMKGWEEGKGGTGDLLKGFAGLDCYPVPPEVGKVGKESPTFIQPVSERSDGIKSFFNKQTTPAKPKSVGLNAKAEPLSPTISTSKAKQEVKVEFSGEAKPKADPEGIKSEITPKDEEPGIGDDSNAPNAIGDQDSKSPVKEEKGSEDGKDDKDHIVVEKEGKEDLSTTLTKRKRDEKGGAGQRTKVVRRDENSDTDQTSITNFFKSPKGKKEEVVPPRRVSSRKKK